MAFSLKAANELLADILSLLTKLVVVVFALVAAILILQTVRQPGFWIANFEVPDSFAADGTTGEILARLLSDEIQSVRDSAFYKLRELKQERMLTDRDSLTGAINVGGVALPIADVFRNLGLDRRMEISGELRIVDDVLQLSIRIPGKRKGVWETPFSDSPGQNSRHAALDQLLALGAEFVVGELDPLILAYAYYSELTDERISKAMQIATSVIESGDRGSPIAHYLIADRLYYHYGDTKGALEAIDRSLALNRGFAAAWHFKARVMINPHAVSIPGQPLQTLEEIYGEQTDYLDRVHQAIQYHETALRYEPDHFFALLDAADLYAFELPEPTRADLRRALNYYERARSSFETYFSRNPSASESYGRRRLDRQNEIVAALQEAE
jgi:tetratricopeptide (TPR) repeat protein